ncbi:MAG: NADH-ubiquinone oxidoreductase subunit NDUFA12 family protein [Alphaproteobacteria bacterium]|nr:NADH-ubiquinone oxidoreductase subunit NDUFA12 family protein [Alphaproteobacteria bacterium]
MYSGVLGSGRKLGYFGGRGVSYGDSAVNLLRFQFGGRLVGEDGEGNRYYAARSRGRRGTGEVSERRWVVYGGGRRGLGRGEVPGLPPGWGAWLHHTGDLPGGAEEVSPVSGVRLPRGHRMGGDSRRSATGDYEAWEPGADTRGDL